MKEEKERWQLLEQKENEEKTEEKRKNLNK